jgi:hypothetical protein
LHSRHRIRRQQCKERQGPTESLHVQPVHKNSAQKTIVHSGKYAFYMPAASKRRWRKRINPFSTLPNREQREHYQFC